MYDPLVFDPAPLEAMIGINLCQLHFRFLDSLIPSSFGILIIVLVNSRLPMYLRKASSASQEVSQLYRDFKF